MVSWGYSGGAGGPGGEAGVSVDVENLTLYPTIRVLGLVGIDFTLIRR